MTVTVREVGEARHHYGQVSGLLVHNLVPARFDCSRRVFLMNQRRWFKHMHDRDSGSFRPLYGGGFNASGQGMGCSLVARVNAATSAAASTFFGSAMGRSSRWPCLTILYLSPCGGVGSLARARP